MNLIKIVVVSLILFLICSCGDRKITKAEIMDDVLGKTTKQILDILGEPDNSSWLPNDPVRNQEEENYFPAGYLQYDKIKIFFNVKKVAFYIDEGEIDTDREILFNKFNLDTPNATEDDIIKLNTMLEGESKNKIMLLFSDYPFIAKTRIWKYQNVEIHFDSENKVTKLVKKRWDSE